MEVILRLFYGDAHILPLLVSIEVHLMLVAVVCDLVVHTVRHPCAEQRLVVLQCLATPHNKYIIRR